MVKKVFLVLVSLVIVTSCMVMAKPKNDEDYYVDGYYCGFITSKLNPCCQGYGDSEKCRQKRYKKWNRLCERNNGNNCTYDFWIGNNSWNEDAWYDYWSSDTYKNVQKVNHKVNVFKRVVNSTKELFTW